MTAVQPYFIPYYSFFSNYNRTEYFPAGGDFSGVEIDEIFSGGYNGAQGGSEMELTDAKGIKKADQEAIRGRGIPSRKLMETAAAALAKAAAELAGPERTAAAFCGPGNNGGDGLAAGRFLMDMGFSVRCFLVGDREKMTEDARAMERELQSAGGTLEDLDQSDPALAGYLKGVGVIVDAIFGVGLSRPLTGQALAAVELINASGRPVASADIPSGVDADTGAVLGAAVKADRTVTFSMAKPGHFAEPGCVYCGEVTVHDIGIPADILAKAGSGVYAIHGGDLALPVRKKLTHKGDYGKLLILAGSVGYTGAASLCAKAAVRSGAGLVYLGVPADIYDITAVKNDEAMPFPLPGSDTGRLGAEAAPEIVTRLETCGTCVLGPGLGRDEGVRQAVSAVLQAAPGPVVADADALWAIGQDLTLLDEAAGPVILTPHEGEFARLLGRPVEDRFRDAGTFAAEHGCAVVLKGYRTLCAFPDGKTYIVDVGNPGMATGGSGDVLAGVIGALLGQMSPRRAVVTACWLHARAGDLAAERLGEYALKAGDIIDALPQAEMEITR